MKESESKRIIIYAILFFLVLLLCISSYYLYFKGYGNDGNVRKEVTPIVDIFNSLKAVEDNPNYLKAKLTNDGMNIKYIIGKYESSYNIIYKEVNEFKLLEFKYELSDYANGEYIAKLLINAVGMFYDNPEGKIFETINYSDLYELNTKVGANLSQRGNTITLLVNINTDMIENLKDINLTNTTVKYITTSELSNLVNELNTNRHFNYYKGSLILDIYNEDNEYVLYCSSDENNYNDIYESIMSSIKLIDSNIYQNIIESNITYNEDFKNEKIELQRNPIVEDNTIAIGNYSIKITITK